MALPQDGQNANGLTKVTQIPAGKELMFIDPTTNEGGIITLEDLTKQILNGLTSQTFGLDSGTQTLPAAINYLYGNHVTIVKEVKITTTEKLSYTGAEITIKENQIALLCFTNNWNDVKPDAMQISTSKTELSVSNIISPEITNYPIRYSIIFSPKIETTLYAWTRHTGENMNGIVKIEGIIFDL